MNSSIANWNCTATFKMCILHRIKRAHFQFRCMGTIIKERDGAKGSNLLLRFGAWVVLIEDKQARFHPKGFGKSRNWRTQYRLQSCETHFFVSPGSSLPVTSNTHTHTQIINNYALTKHHHIIISPPYFFQGISDATLKVPSELVSTKVTYMI